MDFEIGGAAHKLGCECGICQMVQEGMTYEQAWEKYREWEKEQMDKHGWIVHFVQNDERYPTNTNHHTHGLTETYNHPDLQVVVPMPAKSVHNVFIQLIERIKAGEKFKHGDVAENVVNKYSVKFHDAYEGDRHVLRVIVPDVDNNLERDMKGGLAHQYDDL